MYRAGKMLRSFKLAFDKSLVDHDLGGDVRQFISLPGLDLLSHGFEVPRHPIDTDRIQSINENDFECFASTGVNAPGTMFPDRNQMPSAFSRRRRHSGFNSSGNSAPSKKLLDK
jgi:hypothetical protein